MKSINECTVQELQWIHPNKFSGVYELRGGDEVFARFHFKGAFSSQISAETANGNWIIKRKGISQSIIVLARDSLTELATIKRNMSGQARLLTLDGHEYKSNQPPKTYQTLPCSQRLAGICTKSRKKDDSC
jgi:hypothetical protein